MAKRTQQREDFDSPWKDALGYFLKPFLAFFFPDIHADIDWTRGYESLDKEFQQIVRKASTGKKLADKLFKVWHKDGQERWLLIHVEIQGFVEQAFPERMFTYNVRAYQLYNRPVVSLAVLADERQDWRPDYFEYGGWGCRTGIRFPVVKLLDYADKLEALETDANPFAAVVLAHLKALETRQDPEARKHWKLRLVKQLYLRNWKPEDVRELFRLIDWILELPEEFQEAFRTDLHRYEEEKRMRYVTSIERLALKEGLEKGREEGLHAGLLEGITLALIAKFGQGARKVLPRVRALPDPVALRDLAATIETAKTLDEVRKRLQ